MVVKDSDDEIYRLVIMAVMKWKKVFKIENVDFNSYLLFLFFKCFLLLDSFNPFATIGSLVTHKF